MSLSYQARQRLSRFLASIFSVISPEWAHSLALMTLSLSHRLGFTRIFKNLLAFDHPSMKVSCENLGTLPHPIGLGAGYDKNAFALNALSQLGFAWIEAGTVTPQPQSGNSPPRLFRLRGQSELINRMGFNNRGQDRFSKCLVRQLQQNSQLLVGANLGKNKQTPADHAVNDYLSLAKELGDHAKYLVINLSSPNTPGLRDLARHEFLAEIAEELAPWRSKLWVKLDPDMPRSQFQEVVSSIMKLRFVGLVLCNTHRVEWPQAGGLSGHSLASLSMVRLEWAWQVHQGRLPMIASGGIFTGSDVLQRIRRGANAVQIWTALIYRGPLAVSLILEELSHELKLAGFTSLSDAWGDFYRGGTSGS